jgi:DnaJ-class molecular chaperone
MKTKQYETCPKCGGQGLIPEISRNSVVFGVYVTMTADNVVYCDICHGSGKIPKTDTKPAQKSQEAS